MAQIGFKTDKGKKRKKNEDSLFIMPSDNIYIVADGVGGHNSGEIASQTAVKSVAEYVKSNPIEKIRDEKNLISYFSLCLKKVNSIIFDMSTKSQQNKGMATTLVLVYVAGKKAYFVNIGDSRAYIYRDDEISQITEDHTYVNELVKVGNITVDEAKEHPQKNMITRALGGEDKILPDFYQLKIEKNDIIILCTDGLYSELSNDEIKEIISKHDSMNELSKSLVDEANKKGGNDNITVICLKI